MGLTRGKRRMVLRDKLEDAERDRADLIACLRDFVEPVPQGQKGHVDLQEAFINARTLLARLEKGERP